MFFFVILEERLGVKTKVGLYFGLYSGRRKCFYCGEWINYEWGCSRSFWEIGIAFDIREFLRFWR